MKKGNYQIRKDIKESIKKNCLLCGKEDCIKSHSISKKMYLSKIAEDSHVYGSHRQKGLGKLEYISMNEASTYYNFCQECDKIFSKLDNVEFEETNKEQIFLFYYRILAAQIHQIKEEIIFYKKYDHTLAVEQNRKTLNKYIPKLKYFSGFLQKKAFDIFNYKLLKLNCNIKFVYFNIINVLYDLNCNEISERNELAISIFSENNTTNILLIWEKANDEYLHNYINQLLALNIETFQRYLTNIMIAFPFNLFIGPKFYLNWMRKDDFEYEINHCAQYYYPYNWLLFNVFLKREKFNLFLENENLQ